MFFFILWVWFGQSSVPKTEIDLLYTLYMDTEGLNWIWRPTGRPIWNFTFVGEEINPCNTENQAWQGITCSKIPELCLVSQCSITKLDLERYGLRKQLPRNWSDLYYLTHLDLSDNILTGKFPDILPSILLFLDLSDNLLTNSIPLTFGNLHKLTYLDLESNLLSQSLPSTIVSLTSLAHFNSYTNLISGSLPSNFGLLISLTHLDIEDNHFTGPIPSSINTLTALAYFDLSKNYFSKSIPSEIGFVSQLVFFSVELNSMTGTIPHSIGSLTALTHLIFEENYFHGSLPPEIGSLSRLEILSIYVNSFSGLLPSTISGMTAISWLELNQNHLTGPLPPIHTLTNLETFAAFYNLFSSTIPCDFNFLPKLYFLDLEGNNFDEMCDDLSLTSRLENLCLYGNNIHSPIRESFISNLVSLVEFDIAFNYFTGTIPENIYVMTNLGRLNLGENRLTGSIPTSISLLTQLVQLYLPENHLIGSLDEYFTFTSNFSIVNLDLSSNMFDGKIPSELFQLPKLETLALTSNCFHGSIPSSICNAQLLHVVSMDGLGAASGCRDHINFIFNNLMTGNIPSCLWDLRNLTVLSLSGNGLTGSLSSISLPQSSKLKNLTLSHNHLSGSTPHSFQSRYFHHLDLSYNKIRGEYSHVSSSFSNLPKRIILEVNRLSGSLNDCSFDNSTYLNILNGNIFGCGKIPNADVHSKSFSCGSLMLDEALIGACIVIGIGFVLSTIYHFLYPHIRLGIWIAKLKGYFTILDQIHLNVISKELQELSTSMNFLQYLEKITLIIVLCCLLFPIPVYALRWSDNSKYSTHNHLYRWTSTAAYFTGLIPATLLLISWSIGVTVFIYFLRKLKRNTLETTSSILLETTRGNGSISSLDSHLLHTSRNSKITKERLQEILITCSLILINLITIGALNALYIISTTQQNSSLVDFWIKFCVAIFKVLWNSLYLPLLEHSKYPQRLKTAIRVLNSILIPCLTTALTSPSCFQGLLVKPEPITSSYEFKDCFNFVHFPSGLICTIYQNQNIQLAPFIPPFSYNYICGSTILAAYIPIYLYVYTFQLLLPFFSTFILARYVPYSSLPFWIQKKLPGVYWPDYWLSKNLYISEEESRHRHSSMINRVSDSTTTTTTATAKNQQSQQQQSHKQRPIPHLLLKMDNIMTSHMQDFLLLLTFGLCSPLLAIVIGLSIYVSILHVRFIVGRFILHRHPGLADLKLNKINTSYSGSTTTAEEATMVNPAPSSSTYRPTSLQSTSTSRIGSVSVYRSDISLIALTMVISDLGRSYHQVLWVIVWNSCIFWAFLCWDIGGDEVGWNHCLWLPILSVGYIFSIRTGILIERRYRKYQYQKRSSEQGEMIVSNIHDRRSVDIDEENRETIRCTIELNSRKPSNADSTSVRSESVSI